jgi:hypothetical protein
MTFFKASQVLLALQVAYSELAATAALPLNQNDSASNLRGSGLGANMPPTKLWIVNNCGADTEVYYGSYSLPVDATYLQDGGAPLGSFEGTNPSFWIDATNRGSGKDKMCVTNNCNDAGRTLAEFDFQKQDWWDISLVKGFNVGVSIDIIGKMENPSNPAKITCADAYCEDAFMLCDTAPLNVKGGSPNWGNAAGQGLTYKVTFCPSGGQNTKHNPELTARTSLQQNEARYQVSPMPEKVWCDCVWKKGPGSNVVGASSYTQYTGDKCGPIR